MRVDLSELMLNAARLPPSHRTTWHSAPATSRELGTFGHLVTLVDEWVRWLLPRNWAYRLLCGSQEEGRKKSRTGPLANPRLLQIPMKAFVTGGAGSSGATRVAAENILL